MRNIRTDLAIEAHELSKKAGEVNGVESRVRNCGDIKITEVKIISDEGEKALGKMKGNYITIEAPNLKYSTEDYENVCKIIADEIEKMAHIDENSLTLVAGLGNRDITPDALGTQVVSKLLVTHHMKSMFGNNMGNVCAITPGVLGTTGLETVKIVKNIAKPLNPDLIIAVDALAAADIRRVSTTIQITDTGIQPGSGVGNNREGLNRETLGTEVIAIGVPTVIDAATISKDEIPQELAPLMVTTKDIDVVIERMAKTVANGINLALHKGFTLQEIESYTA